MELNDVQSDLLKEAFNLGVGTAAASLSELAGGLEIVLTVPELEMISISELQSVITQQAGDHICGVSETFKGPFEGRATMLYSQEESLELVRIMLGETIPVEDLSEMEGEALCEVGNIVLNACISSLANLIQEEIETDVPILTQGTCSEVMAVISNSSEHNVLHLRMDFSLARHNLRGHLGFVFDINAARALAECLEAYFQKMLEM